MFIKNIIKYVFILALIGVGICAILCAVMMFVPNVSILGYRYVSASENLTFELSGNPTVVMANIDYVPENSTKQAEAEKLANAYKNVDSIDIDAQNMNVLICPSTSLISNGGFYVIRSIIHGNGFCKASTETPVSELIHTFKPELVLNQDQVHYTLKIRCITIDGFINLSSRKLEISLPKDIAENLKNVTIKTKDGSILVRKDASNNHNINDAVLRISERSIFQSVGGNITLKDCKINQLEAESTYGTMTFGADVEDYNGGSTLKGVTMLKNEFGKIVFESTKEKSLNVSNIKIESGISRIKVNNVADTIEYIGESAYLEIGEVTGSITIKSVDATINIAKLVKTSGKPDSRFYITNILPEGKKSFGSISFKINKIEASEINLTTNNGSITIDEMITSSEKCVLQSNSGNITVKKLTGDIKAISTKGNIKISQDKYNDNSVHNAQLKNSVIDIQSKSGNVVLKGIVGTINLDVQNGGNSPIDITFVEVNKNCKINAQKGVMKLHLPLLLLDKITPNVYNLAFFKLVDANIVTAPASIDMKDLWPYVEVTQKDVFYYINDPEGKFTGDVALNNSPIIYIYSTGKVLIDNEVAVAS